MSEQSSKLQWKQQLSQPKVMIMIVVIIFILFNVLLYILSTSPSYSEKRDAKEDIHSLYEKLQLLARKPDAEKASKDDIEKLLLQVPTLQVKATVVEDIFDFVYDADVWITLISEEKSTDEETEDLEDRIKELESSANTEEAENVTTTKKSKNKKQGIFTPTTYKVSAVGGLPQLINFFDLVENNPSITSVKEWNFVEVEKDQVKELIPDYKGDETIFSLALTITMYSIPQYINLFGPPQSKGISVDEMLQRLQGKYPDLQPLQAILLEEEEQ